MNHSLKSGPDHLVVLRWSLLCVLVLKSLLVGATEGGAGETRRKPGDRKPLDFTGVNLAGGEFGAVKEGRERVYGKDYILPSSPDLDYFGSNGFNIVRLPFRWEDLQPALNQSLNALAMERVRAVVAGAGARRMVTILDPHNYARYRGRAVGSPEASNQAYADFWKRVAQEFKNDPLVWFGLMNEPHDLPNEQWLAAANAGIVAIRGTGATNLILVPGNAWTGAHSWFASKNAEFMLKVVDPLNHCVFEVHQYLDKDSSGTKPEAVSEKVGRERLQRFTEWCRTHQRRGFLGETAAADNATASAAMDDMLSYMEENREVWVGFTWWAAGPWWGEYMFSLQPKNGRDRPQMGVLRPHLQRR